jgi:hypothetical protein
VHTSPLRRLGPVAALTLTALTALAACTSAGATKPVTQPAASAPPAVANPTTAAVKPVQVTAPRTTGPTTARPPTGSGCLGAVVHRLDASDTGAAWKQLCITVGGVLLVTNLGPEGFAKDSADKVECNYAAGTRECRMLHAGTVRFTITNAGQTRTLDLRITKSSSKPSPACSAAGATFTINAADGGPQGWPVCMRTSGTVRVENLGPEGFQARPAGAVTCSYEAAVRICRFNRAETVTFTTTHGDSAPRTQTVVAVR